MIISLDVGDKRIGIAKEIFGMVFPVKTLFRKNLSFDMGALKELFISLNVTEIVCGLPVNFDGTPSVQTQKTLNFIEELKKITSVPIFTIDERCTTMQAKDELIGADYSRQERKKVIDQVAAMYILEDYLRKKNNGGK